MSSWRDDHEELLAAQNEIRRLHSVFREKYGEIQQLEKEVSYWKNRCVNVCREERHPVFISAENSMFIDTDAPAEDIERWMEEEDLRDLPLIEYLRSCQYYADILWSTQSTESQKAVLAMAYRDGNKIQRLSIAAPNEPEIMPNQEVHNEKIFSAAEGRE